MERTERQQTEGRAWHEREKQRHTHSNAWRAAGRGKDLHDQTIVSVPLVFLALQDDVREGEHTEV